LRLITFAVLILVNAIYFRGVWEYQFKKGKTRESDFFLTSGETARVPLMSQKATFRYAEKHAIQILEMEYKRYKRSGTTERVSMIVFLPSERDGLPKLEEEFTAEFIQQSIASLRKLEVEVFFPRFSLETAYKLNEAIKNMGIVAAFTEDANFSGMTDDPRGLKIESIIHRATIDVGEKGTVAAAATMVEMTLIGLPPPPPVFRADHPFIFLLRDVNTGIILFIGKLEVPRG
jgi:serpin B